VIGVAEPEALRVRAEGWGRKIASDAAIERAIRAVFKLTPAAIIRDLDLLRPIYQKTASGGHFGRQDPEFTWERTDRAAEVASAVSKA
jgi:S-adenosylmethionine synthetase